MIGEGEQVKIKVRLYTNQPMVGFSDGYADSTGQGYTYYKEVYSGEEVTFTLIENTNYETVYVGAFINDEKVGEEDGFTLIAPTANRRIRIELIYIQKGMGFIYKESTDSYVFNRVTDDKFLLNKVEIPKLYNDGEHGLKPVTEVADELFKNREDLTSVIGGGNIITIGNSVCENCVNLTDFGFSPNVVSIGDRAFFNTAYANTFAVGANLKYFGEGVFAKSNFKGFLLSETNEKYKVINESLYIIEEDDNVLWSVKQERSDKYYISKETTKVAKYAFSGVKTAVIDFERDDISTVAGNSKFIEIGEYAFAYSEIYTVNLPNTIEKIGDYAFYSSKKLENLFMHNLENVKEIGKYAFAECENFDDDSGSLSQNKGIQDLTTPSRQFFTSVNEIGEYAFYNCKEIDYGDVKFSLIEGDFLTIGDYAFSYSGIKSIEFQNTKIASISNVAFSQTKLRNLIISDTKEVNESILNYLEKAEDGTIRLGGSDGIYRIDFISEYNLDNVIAYAKTFNVVADNFVEMSINETVYPQVYMAKTITAELYKEKQESDVVVKENEYVLNNYQLDEENGIAVLKSE